MCTDPANTNLVHCPRFALILVTAAQRLLCRLVVRQARCAAWLDAASHSGGGCADALTRSYEIQSQWKCYVIVSHVPFKLPRMSVAISEEAGEDVESLVMCCAMSDPFVSDCLPGSPTSTGVSNATRCIDR